MQDSRSASMLMGSPRLSSPGDGKGQGPGHLVVVGQPTDLLGTGCQAQAGEPASQGGEAQRQLQPGHMLARAEVNAATESQVAAGLTLRQELVRVGEATRVP